MLLRNLKPATRKAASSGNRNSGPPPLVTYGLDLGESGPMDSPIQQLDIELECFRRARTVEEGGLGKAEHFWRAAALLWPATSARPFERHPEAERIINAKCKHQDIAISGHKSSAKSDCMAAYALITWLADPYNALVIIVSTTIQGAKKRIWAHIERRYMALPKGRPGRLYVNGRLKMEDGSDSSGIHLFAGISKKSAETTDQISGMVVVSSVLCVFDEGTSLAQAMYDAYFSNLRGKGDFSEFAALGNFHSTLDPFGVLCDPAEGWDKASPDTHFEWQGPQAWVVRLDGLQAPNWLSKENKFPYLQKWEEIQEYLDLGRTHTLEWWRMVRSWPSPSASGQEHVYDESELNAHIHKEPPSWDSAPELFGGLDPAFTKGRCSPALTLIHVGFTKDGKLAIHPFKIIHLQIEMDHTGINGATYQIISQLKEIMAQHGLKPENLGTDGSHDTFVDVLHREISPKIFASQFRGKASDRCTSKSDPRPNCQRFKNRVSEVWGMGLDFLRGGCWYAVPHDLLSELNLRLWDPVENGPTGIVKKVESKLSMRSRSRHSVDAADAFLVAIDVAQRRKHLRPEQGTPVPGAMERRRKMRSLQNRLTAPAPAGYTALISRLAGRRGASTNLKRMFRR